MKLSESLLPVSELRHKANKVVKELKRPGAWMAVVVLGLLSTSCQTHVLESPPPSVVVTFDQRDPQTRQVVRQLGQFNLDVSQNFGLERAARKRLSIAPTPYLRFRTWRRIDDGIHHSLLLLIKEPNLWYYGLIIDPAATLIYGDNNPTAFEGEVFLFFLEGLLPVPKQEIPLFIEAAGFLDSLMVDPARHTIPQRYVTHLTRNELPAPTDSLMLFVTAVSDQLLDPNLIPILGHTLRTAGDWDGIWTMELFNRTTDFIGTLPSTGVTPDYQAFMLTLKAP